MVAWAIKGMGGMIPRQESRALPDNMAEQAVNCDLSSGALDGLPIPEKIIDLTPHPGTVRAYRFPLDGTPDVWLALQSPFSSVCRSPLANDTNHRLYWTNPPGTPGAQGAGAFWSNRANIQNNVAPFVLGIVQPVTAPTVAVTGSSSAPLVDRAYAYTFVNAQGEESAPSPPSTVVEGDPTGTWTVGSLPTSVPNPSGVNYSPVVSMNLYRTITGATSGAQFYLVTNFSSFPPPSPYTDTTLDLTIVNNQTLISTGWGNPPAGLDGLTALAGGMLVGFTGNTVHFCEPDRPHAWPPAYDQSLQYQIVGFGVWQQSLVVLTQGFPSTGSGNSPSNYVFTQVRVPEPCIARGSIITDLMGVYYASQNGLVMLNYYGMQNQTLTTMTKNIWLTDFAAASIIACRHRAQYLAVRLGGTGNGFIIDYTEQRLGVVNIVAPAGTQSIWNDEYSGDTYICVNGVVYRWDSQNTGSLIWRWRSKQFYAPAPHNLGACQISLDPSVVIPPKLTVNATLGNVDLSADLNIPNGVNAVFNLFAGPDGEHLVFTRILTQPRELFRLPSGFKTFNYQCEILARVAVHSIELASTMGELKGV